MQEQLPEPGVPKERAVRKRSASQKISLVPAGFQLAITGVQAKEEQAEIYADRDGSFSDSMNRVDSLEPAIDRERSLRMQGLIVSGGSALSTVFELDPLEEYRKQTGLTEERERLMIELHRAYSFERGLKLLNSAVGGEKYHSMEEVNRDFPNITKYEVVLFSLLKHFPRLYLSSEYDSDDLTSEDKRLIKVSIPNIIGATVNGIEISLDLENSAKSEESDAYHNLGMTGVQEESYLDELIDFREDVKKIFVNSIPLTVKSQRLFERVWERFDVALQDGFRSADRHALEKVLGRSFDRKEKLRDIEQQLSDEQRKEWIEEKKLQDKKIGKSIVINPLTQQVFRPQDLVKLTGLLHDFPRILVREEPFEGYVIPFGTGVLFVDHSTQERQYFSFHSYYIREALQGIGQEAIDPSKYNQVFLALFQEVSGSIRSKVLDEVEKTGEDPSLLEGKYIDTKIRFDIDVEPNSAFDIKVKSDWEEMWLSRGGQRRTREISYKFGNDELDHIAEVIRLVPDEMLARVKHIKKQLLASQDLEEYLEGKGELGHYEPLLKTIVLSQIQGRPYGSLKPEEKAMYSFTLLHEIGHGVWDGMPEDIQAGWMKISDAQGINETANTEDFLTWYSKASPNEDFSECMAAYILHGQDFRDAAQKNPHIAQKYDFVKTVFSSVANLDREYPQLSPFHLGDLHNFAQSELQKHSVEEAIVEFAARNAVDDVAIRERTSEIAESMDEASVDDVLDLNDTESALYDLTREERVEREDEIGYRRTMVSSFVDYFTDNFTPSTAKKYANRMYSMIEEGNIEGALRLARMNADDLVLEEFEELIRKVSEDIETGKDRVDNKKIYS